MSGVLALTAPFFAVEIEAFQPAGGSITPVLGWGMVPWGMLSLSTISDGATTTIRASDVGYRTKATDPGGVKPYPPIVAEAFQITRQLQINFGDPNQDWSWGSVSLANDGRFDGIAGSMNCDRRPVSIRRGRKPFSESRGIFTDPAYTDLVLMFSGIAQPWFLDSTVLRVPMRDASYWLERPYQQSRYGGTGLLEGDASMAGVAKPRTRGGTAAHPVRRVKPVRVSSSPIVYQYSDGPGTVVKLYEGAAEVFVSDGNVTNLFLGAPAPGHYRTDNAHAAFQLGSEPVNEITCDVTGAFPIAGAISVIPTIARYILTEDMQLPGYLIDLASFSAAATSFPYTGGIYFSPDDAVDGTTAIFRVLSSIAARCIASRTGQLQFKALRALSGMETPTFTINLQNCASLIPVPMPAALDPPPYRVRLAYMHNNTVNNGSFNGVALDTEKLYAQLQDQFVQFTNGAISITYARPNDLTPFGGAMLIQSEAQTVIDEVGTLLCARRRIYEAHIPTDVAIDADLGDVVKIQYPLDDLQNGRLGQVIGESFDSGNPYVTLRVLV